MSSDLWPPAVTSTPSQLLAGLSPTERLLGYDALIEAAIRDLPTTITTACLRSSRRTAAGRVPSVLVVLDDRLVEYWLSGTTVERAAVRRPRRDG